MNTQANQFVIESDVPIPAGHRNSGLWDTLRKLKVGESVFVPGASHYSVNNAGGQVLGKGNFVARKETKDGIYGHRIWRTA